MTRLITSIFVLICLALPAQAGIDETINNITAPIATLIGQIVFFKIPVFGANLTACRAVACRRRGVRLPSTWVS